MDVGRTHENAIIPDGTVFGDMTVVTCAGLNHNRKRVYLVRCNKCGREKIMVSYAIKQNKGVSHKGCGRGMKSDLGQFYTKYHSMRARTSEHADDWHKQHYFDKGITSDAFESFVDFYDTMYASYVEHVKVYGEDNTTLDRIDSTKSYTPENCRWATWEVQENNTSRNIDFIAISPTGEEFTAHGAGPFAREHGLYIDCIYDCLAGRSNSHYGWRFKNLT
jgi:hypothetical protein